MRMYSFGPEAGRHIDRFGSDFVLSPLTNPDGAARAACMYLGPGGLVGEHEAVAPQLFCVVDGEGWVSGSDGVRKPIRRSQAAHWNAGEVHAAGTETALTAIVLEGNGFEVWARLEPEPS